MYTCDVNIRFKNIFKTVGIAKHNIAINTLAILQLTDTTPYALAKASELPAKTIYSIIDEVEHHQNLSFYQTNTLLKLVHGLNKFLDKKITVDKLLSDSRRPCLALLTKATDYDNYFGKAPKTKGQVGIEQYIERVQEILDLKPKAFSGEHLVFNSRLDDFRLARDNAEIQQFNAQNKSGETRISGNDQDDRIQFLMCFFKLANLMIDKHLFLLDLPDIDAFEYPKECKTLIKQSKSLISEYGDLYGKYGGNLKESLNILTEDLKYSNGTQI